MAPKSLETLKPAVAKAVRVAGSVESPVKPVSVFENEVAPKATDVARTRGASAAPQEIVKNLRVMSRFSD